MNRAATVGEATVPFPGGRCARARAPFAAIDLDAMLEMEVVGLGGHDRGKGAAPAAEGRVVIASALSACGSCQSEKRAAEGSEIVATARSSMVTPTAAALFSASSMGAEAGSGADGSQGVVRFQAGCRRRRVQARGGACRFAPLEKTRRSTSSRSTSRSCDGCVPCMGISSVPLTSSVNATIVHFPLSA